MPLGKLLERVKFLVHGKGLLAVLQGILQPAQQLQHNPHVVQAAGQIGVPLGKLLERVELLAHGQGLLVMFQGSLQPAQLL